MSKPKELPKWRPRTLSKMTVPELLRLKRALEGSEGMLVDSGIYKVVVDTIWDRSATPVLAWPISKLETGVRIVHFCTKASDGWIKNADVWTKEAALGPDDPEHQPVRRVRPRSRVASSQTLGDVAGDWGFEWYECSCGIRDGDVSNSGQRATGQRWRVEGELGGWLRSDEGEGAQLNLRDRLDKPFDPNKPVWLVCKRAAGLDDREHAHCRAHPGRLPHEGTMRATFICICGSSSYDDEIKRIPIDSCGPRSQRRKAGRTK